MTIASASMIYTPYAAAASFPADTPVTGDTDITAATGPRWVPVEATAVVSLPNAADNDQCELLILNTGSFTVTIRPKTGEKINGVTGDQTLTTPLGVMRLKSNGVDGWYSPTEVVP